jgi:hypothetical protein
MPCLFTAGLLSWALIIGKGKYRNIGFSRKVLTRFSIRKYAKNQHGISFQFYLDVFC